MKLFKLVGKESVLNLHLEHPIHLEENAEYKLALTGFYSDNNIANLREDSLITFFITKDNPKSDFAKYVKRFSIDKGYWTIETLQSKCRKFLQTLKDIGDADVDPTKFSIIKHRNRIGITSPFRFYLDSNLRNLLGFNETENKDGVNQISKFSTADELVVGDRSPNFVGVDVIEIHCNLVEHSFVQHDENLHRHDETEILYHFFHNVPNSYKISETPQEKFYVPLKKVIRSIKEIKVTIKDQNNQLLINDDVNNIIYLSLIKQ